ncbi:MAG: hypothetical protein IPN76_17590 [Saprospiraceae bacterium]|nr:hypothetical protein [Saprospiraceae bacterium]
MVQHQALSDKKKKGNMLFPQKHRKALKGIALVSVLEARKSHPEWNLNDTLSDLVKGFNPDFPPDFLLEFTQHIIQHWVALEKKAAAESTAAVAA